MLRAMRPELPDDPEPDQVEARVELAELVQDPDFRASVRRMAEYQAAERDAGDRTGLHDDLSNYVRERVAAALAAGIDPAAARPHQRYVNLLHVINGWPTQPSLSPIFDWITCALRSHASSSRQVVLARRAVRRLYSP